jgi:hypothetical protein
MQLKKAPAPSRKVAGRYYEDGEGEAHGEGGPQQLLDTSTGYQSPSCFSLARPPAEARLEFRKAKPGQEERYGRYGVLTKWLRDQSRGWRQSPEQGAGGSAYKWRLPDDQKSAHEYLPKASSKRKTDSNVPEYIQHRQQVHNECA